MLKNISEMLNKQINEELISSYVYLNFAASLDHMGLSGYANWYKVQAKEEIDHARKLYDYLNDLGEKVTLYDIPILEIPGDLKGILRMGLSHEKHITKLIHLIYKACLENNDFATAEFLNWFIKEQVEEEKNATDLLNQFESFKDSLFLLDKEAGKRE